jgi:hypothetical protein
MENTEIKSCPSSVADLESQHEEEKSLWANALSTQMNKVDQLIAFLEYENAYTADPMTERRIRLKLIELGIWPSQQKN